MSTVCLSGWSAVSAWHSAHCALHQLEVNVFASLAHVEPFPAAWCPTVTWSDRGRGSIVICSHRSLSVENMLAGDTMSGSLLSYAARRAHHIAGDLVQNRPSTTTRTTNVTCPLTERSSKHSATAARLNKIAVTLPLSEDLPLAVPA